MKARPCLFLFFGWFAVLVVGLAPCEGALVVYYDFNDGAAAAVTDVSGNGHVGSFSGAPVYTDPGMGFNNTPGRAMQFHGFADRIQVDDGATAFDSLLTTGATSIAFWVLGDTLGDPRPGFPVTNFSAFNGAALRELMAHVPWEDGVVYFDVGGGAAPGVNRISRDANADQFEGGWDHWIFTKEGSGTQGMSSIYVNNTLFLSAPTSAAFGDIESFFVGGNGQNAGEGYWGLMDEFAVWDHALTPAERTRVFNGTVIPEPSSAALLIAGFLVARGRTDRGRRA